MNNTAEKRDSNSEKPDIKQLMQNIREKIKHADLQDKRPKFRSFEANDAREQKAGEILHSDELRYLNEHYSYMPKLELERVASHRFGIIGKLLVSLKCKVLVVVWDFLLKDYFERERQFQARLVRLLNDQAKYIDARDAGNFWELIRKIDVDIQNLVERMDRLQDEYLATQTSLEKKFNDQVVFEMNKQLGAVHGTQAKLEQELKTVDSVVRGLEGIAAKSGFTPNNAAAVNTKENVEDYSYLLLENRYRGSEEDVKARQVFYANFFMPGERKVLEIGPGRGELQEIFREKNIASYGVDIDKAMIEHSQNKEFDVQLGDGIAHLRSLEDGSLAGVIALQVVEHLEPKTLQELCRLAKQKVVPGGAVIFETINPISLLALSSHYFRDPTHVCPLHPETLEYTMTLSGLQIEEVKFLSELPEGSQLLKIDAEESMPIRWLELVKRYNHNVERLNSLLYGHMDYCIVGRA